MTPLVGFVVVFAATYALLTGAVVAFDYLGRLVARRRYHRQVNR